MYLVHNPRARRSETVGLREYWRHVRALRGALGENSYDAFMDDHVGFTLQENDFIAMLADTIRDGHAVLTRREPYTAMPSQGWGLFQWEKFSFFVLLPESKFPLQIQVPKMDMPSLQVGVSAALGAPQTLRFNFCDWDFCPNFANYRDVHKRLLDDPEVCGLSAMRELFVYLNLSDASDAGLAARRHEAGAEAEAAGGGGAVLAAAPLAAQNAPRGGALAAAALAAAGCAALVVVRRRRRNYVPVAGAER